MPKCVFDRTTFKYLGGSRYDDMPHDPTIQIQLELPEFPDPTYRWDGALGIRPATQAELDADLAAKLTLSAQNWDDVKVAIRALIRVIAPKLNMQPQDLMQAVRTEYRNLIN